MAGLVAKTKSLLCLLTLASMTSVASAQSGWGEPIAPPPEPEAPPTSPNPDWQDPPPPIRPQESVPRNPDWVEADEPPPMKRVKRSASQLYGIRYATRNLTMPRGMMRGTFDTVAGRDTTAGRRSAETVSTMSFGAAITLADDFEIGFSRYRMASFPSISLRPTFGFGGEGLIAFKMSPEAQFGDIPFYARFEALDRGVVKLALDAVFRIPSQTTFGFLGGATLRFVIQDRFAIDTGVDFTVDHNPKGPELWSLDFPLKLVANATDRLFFEVRSGMTVYDLTQTVRTVTSGLIQGPFYFIPLGLRAGYTVEPRATMMDIFASFGFPTFYGFTTRDSSLTPETWQVTIGLNIYSPALFKGSAL